jgi:signal transduction histidine kinase
VSRHAEELEKQVAERTRVLNDTVKSLEGVCYTIAHDLRAPLRTLQGFSQILLEDYASSFDEEGRRYAERIVTAASRMDTLIRDLLDYARLTHQELPMTPLNLAAEVQQVMTQLMPEIEARHAEIIVKPLPQIVGNGTLLIQVITNLLSNALKFVAADTVPRVEIWSEQRDGMVRMFVKDNGIGIDPSQHGRIFGLFQRLHRPDAYPGTGLGLAIVRKGMERMGGAVGVESAPGRGSCFYVDLRLVSGER